MPCEGGERNPDAAKRHPPHKSKNGGCFVSDGPSFGSRRRWRHRGFPGDRSSNREVSWLACGARIGRNNIRARCDVSPGLRGLSIRAPRSVQSWGRLRVIDTRCDKSSVRQSNDPLPSAASRKTDMLTIILRWRGLVLRIEAPKLPTLQIQRLLTRRRLDDDPKKDLRHATFFSGRKKA